MRRIGTLSVILLGSSFLLYNLAAISGDPIGELKISQDPRAKQQIIALTRELQLNIPPPFRYFLWLRGVLGIFVGKLDLGSTRTGESVGTAITSVIPTTLRLVFTAFILAMVIGISVGIVTALRQYSKFDYSMTFVSFLLFSLPIFWVAVLLKQFMAIQFNNWLDKPTISLWALSVIGIVIGLIVASIAGGERRKSYSIFSAVAAATMIVLWILQKINWFLEPGFGPIFFFIASIGIAFGVTQLSVGINNKSALKASITMAVAGLVFYYPTTWAFKLSNQSLVLLAMAATTFIIAVVISLFFAKIDKIAIIRTSILTGIFMGLIRLLDQLMSTWPRFISTDAINYRPVPTVGQANSLLEPGDYWVTTLDLLMHLILPTIALTAISFAGYIRFARGTMLEVLNQDYIRTARAKGLSERTVIMRHAFRNTLIPLSTIIVVDFAGIIGGAIITERVFGWKGMGTLFNMAINSFDLNLLMGVFFLTGTLSLMANLVADLLYSALDPRIRTGSGA
jgi:peptide/nickel transport system permease protein